MQSFRLFGAALMVAGSLSLSGAVPLIAQGLGPADAAASLTSAREQAARARERSIELDREAASATAAGARATLAAAALAARVQQAEAAVAASRADLVLVGERRRALEVRLSRERAPAMRLMAGLQTLVRRPPMLVLLQPGSIEETVRLRAVVAAVAPQIRARTQALRADVAEAEALEAEARALAAQRSAMQRELEHRRSELTAASAAERLKARRAAGAADQEAARAYAIGERARSLSALVRQLQATHGTSAATGAATARPAPAAGQPLLRPPVVGATGSARPGKTDAIDYRTAPGALVVAPSPGRIAFAGPYRGFRSIVIIEHADGWTSLITGLGALQVAVGQLVVAGSALGQADLRDPTVRFELRRGGAAVNPRDFVR